VTKPLFGILDEINDDSLFALGAPTGENGEGLPSGVEAAYDAFLAECKK